MAVILNIETSTNICSVALSKDGGIEFHKEAYEGPSHAKNLGVFVEEALKFAQSKNFKIDAVAVSCGPGSYTGLRIGVSEAKGLCFGLDVPLIAVNTLQVLTTNVMFNGHFDETAYFCPMIDARRMEVYSAIYDLSLNEIKPISADIIDDNSYKKILDKNIVYFFGDGASKCEKVINHPNARFIQSILPIAYDMVALAEIAFRKSDFKDVAYFEPFYLKEFVATKPKNKVI
ncbi:MAG: tRNA (adenosine(37)-N6)-threonylcarbamoyltransferase complex dimerization subunit type 1 TsaB [Bacteroidales bacterium]|nr:tRNA (adenosine(37)-N6)-threonylcarbamoyltransferase complex dimerization subunit type 1 TsaB [Bacteroidales bacterium]